MSYKQTVLKLLEHSAIIAKKHFGKVSSKIKKNDNNQVLTVADLEIGRYIVDVLKKTYPTHNIIDEELGVVDKGSDHTWVVDPIDGTSNFAAGLPSFGIIIGLLINNVPSVGAVVLPSFNEVYYGEKGLGAYCNGKKIKVTEQSDLLKTLVAYGIDSNRENYGQTIQEMNILGRIVNGVQNLRSTNSVYDAMMVASGKYGGYLNQRMKIWDVIGLQVIIEEAGGKVSDFRGNNLNYKDHISGYQNNFTFISASARLHPKLIDLVR